MNSPSQSAFAGEPLPMDAPLRWQGAAIFAGIPAAILLLFQVGLLFQSDVAWSVTTWEPALYLIVPTALAAACGFYGADRCVKASGWGTVGLGAVFGCIGSLGALVAGNMVANMQGAPRADQLSMFFAVAVLLTPYAIGAVALTRFLGRKQVSRLRAQ